MLYFTLRTIHIISATLLFGTGIGSAYYMLRTHLSNDVHAIAVTTRHVVAADWLFTTTSGIVQPITGVWIALHMGWPLTHKWILISLVLYLFAGACGSLWFGCNIRYVIWQRKQLPITHRCHHCIIVICEFGFGWAGPHLYRWLSYSF